MMGFPGGSVGKESACNAGDPGLIPGSGRFPGEGNGNPFQHSSLGNPMDRGTWQATVHEATRGRHNLGTKPPSSHEQNAVGASKVMFKILHATLHQYLNQELPDIQVGFRKGRGTRD